MLQKRLISLVTDKTINTKMDPKTQVFAGLNIFKNGMRTRAGELRKKPGFEQIVLTVDNYAPGSNDIAGDIAANSVHTFQDQVALLSRNATQDAYYFYQKNGAAQEWNTYDSSKFERIGLVSEVPVSSNGTYSVTAQDVTVNGDIACVVYSRDESTPSQSISIVYAAFYRVSTGDLIRNDLLISGGWQPRVVSSGNYFIVFWFNGTRIATRTILVADGTLGGIDTSSPALNVSITGVNLRYDIVRDRVQNYFHLLTVSDTTQIRYEKFSALGAYISGNTVSTARAPTGGLSIDVDTNEIIYAAIGLNSSAEVVGVKHDPVSGFSSFTSITGTLTGIMGPVTLSLNGGLLHINYAKAETNSAPDSIWALVSDLAFSSVVSRLSVNQGGIASHHFYQTGKARPDYFIYSGEDFGSYFMSPTFTAQALREQGVSKAALGYYQWSFPRPIYLPASNKVLMPLRKIVSASESLQANQSKNFGLSLSIVDLSNQVTPCSVSFGKTTLVGGGVLRVYDGQNVAEAGWFTKAAPPSLSIVSAGTGKLTAGSYQYVVVFEWFDRNGQIYRSTPTQPVSVTLASLSNVQVTIPYNGITTHYFNNIIQNTLGTINIYRTLKDGTVFYKIAEYENRPNDVSLDLTFTDDTANADVGNLLLYTTGGTLPDEAPPASNSFFTAKNRVFLIPSEDSDTYWYSKQFIPNEGVAFSSTLQGRVEGGLRGLVGGAEMDDKVVFFKRNSCYFIFGDGTDNFGQGSFSEPQVISSVIGCIDRRSIVKTSVGIMFKSARGIWLINRGLEAQYIGAEVELYNNRTITSAVHIEELNQVRFTTAEGIILVFDTVFNEWAVWGDELAATSAVVADRKYSICRKLNGNTNLWTETEDKYLDASALVITQIGTVNIQFAQIQGYQRVYRLLFLGEYRGAHKLRVSLAYDNKEYFEERFEITPTSTKIWSDDTYQEISYDPDETIDNVWQFEVRPARQQCSALRILIEDNFDGIENETGNSFTISNIAAEVGVEGGRKRIVPTTKVMLPAT